MKLLESFKWAISGILFAVRTERNFRIHLVAIVYVLFFSSFYALTKTEYIVLVILFAGVTAMEMVNTAVEHVVDLIRKKQHVDAKIAKDVSAGAVLIMAIGAAVIGVFLFWDIAVFKKIAATVFLNPLYCAAFLLSVGLSVWYVKSAKKEKE